MNVDIKTKNLTHEIFAVNSLSTSMIMNLPISEWRKLKGIAEMIQKQEMLYAAVQTPKDIEWWQGTKKLKIEESIAKIYPNGLRVFATTDTGEELETRKQVFVNEYDIIEVCPVFVHLPVTAISKDWFRLSSNGRVYQRGDTLPENIHFGPDFVRFKDLNNTIVTQRMIDKWNTRKTELALHKNHGVDLETKVIFPMEWFTIL